MSAFSYFDESHNQDDCDDDNDDDNTDNDDDPFLPPFTPRSRMHILRKSFASNSSTLYLVSKEPVKSLLNLIKPVHENPYFTQEPDWSLIRKRSTDDRDRVSRERLLERCQALEIALDRAKQQIRARDVVIEASRATAAILKLQAQKLRSALHMKEKSQQRREKTTISLNVGDGAVITEVLGFCLYPINPGRFSNQYHTGADRLHTNTPQVVVGIEEPQTPRLTARTLSYRTGFLLSATNTQYEEVGINERNPMCRFSPDSPGVALTSESASTLNTHRNKRSRS